MKQPVTFYSEGCKLAGDLYLPEGLRTQERRAAVVWVGAVDPRVKCIVSVVGVGHGRRWMRSVRRPDEWHDLLDRAKADREKRVLDGQSAMADRSQILLPDRQSAELAAVARRANPAAVNELPLEFIDDTLGFHPEWLVDKIT